MTSGTRVTRATWIAVAVFCVAVAGVAGWLFDELRRSAEDGAARQAQAVARGAETTLNRAILDLDLLLSSLSELPRLWNPDGSLADAADAARTLKVMAEQRLLVRDLALLDAGGRIVAAADEATVRLGLALPAGFLDTVLGQPAPQLVVSVPGIGLSSGEKVLHVARPIGPPGSGRFVALATVPVSELNAVLTPAVRIPGLWVSLESEQGVMLASVPAMDSLLGRQLALPDLPEPAASDGPSVTAPGRLHGEPSFVSMRPTVYPSVVVVAGIEMAAAAASVQDERRATVAIGVVFVALALGAGALAQASLSRVTAASTAADQARQTLEQALAAVEEGFLLWDADGRVVMWNERYLGLFPYLRPVMRVGVTLDEVAETAARAFLPDGSEQQRRDWIAARKAERREEGHVFEQHVPNGRVVKTAERATAAGGVVSIYRDVTRERQAAEELGRARRAAEAANEAKTRFLATMSHEIRTPLNGVLGMNGLLLATPLDAKQRMYAETIRRSGEGLLAIINEVLDMSRLEAGRMRLEPTPFDPVDLVDEVAALLRPRAADKGITLAVEHADLAQGRLLGDAGRIRQVLFNLVGNAVKFTEQGGVRVCTSRRPLDDGRCEWTFSIHDTGIGIAGSAMPTLFERFTQADDRISRHYGGSGLGLAISRELVELMGGRIDVRSRSGEGSVFTVKLPLPRAGDDHAAPAGPSPGDDRPVPGAARPLRVLVAEDNHINQMVLTAMLGQLGHYADVVGNGREALEQVQQVQYDIVLMDLQMPEMDGVTAAYAIRRLPGPTGKVPIVAVSANVLPEHQAACRSAGVNDLVPKPIDLDRLARSIVAAMA